MYVHVYIFVTSFQSSASFFYSSNIDYVYCDGKSQLFPLWCKLYSKLYHSLLYNSAPFLLWVIPIERALISLFSILVYLVALLNCFCCFVFIVPSLFALNALHTTTGFSYFGLWCSDQTQLLSWLYIWPSWITMFYSNWLQLSCFIF